MVAKRYEYLGRIDSFLINRKQRQKLLSAGKNVPHMQNWKMPKGKDKVGISVSGILGKTPSDRRRLHRGKSAGNY